MKDKNIAPFTRVPNDILEKTMKIKLGGRMMRILLVVWRNTYGWSRTECKLSLNYLSEAINVDKSSVSKLLKELFEMGILIEVKKYNGTNSRLIAFNEQFVLDIDLYLKLTRV